MKVQYIFFTIVAAFLLLIFTPESVVAQEGPSCGKGNAEALAALSAIMSSPQELQLLVAYAANVSPDEVDVDDPNNSASYFTHSPFCFDGNGRRVPLCGVTDNQVCVQQGTQNFLVPYDPNDPDSVSDENIATCKENPFFTFGTDPAGSFAWRLYLTDYQNVQASLDSNDRLVMTPTTRGAINTIAFHQILGQTLSNDNVILDYLNAAALSTDPSEKEEIYRDIFQNLTDCLESSDSPFLQYRGGFIDYTVSDIVFGQSCDNVPASCEFVESPQVFADNESEVFKVNTRINFKCVQSADILSLNVNGEMIKDIPNTQLENGVNTDIDAVVNYRSDILKYNTSTRRVDDAEFVIMMDGATLCARRSNNPQVEYEPPEDPIDFGGLQGKAACRAIVDPTTENYCLACLEQRGTWTALGCILTTPEGIFAFLIRIAIGVMGGLALLRMIYLGYLYQTKEEAKIKEAKQGVISTITAIFVVIFSVVILRIIGVNILDVVPAGFFG